MANISSSALLSEAVSFLNGAHLNPRGQLSNLFRRYHQTLSTVSSTISDGGSSQPTPSVSSVVLSKLGIDKLTNEQLSQALANSWTSLNIHAVGANITVNDVLKQCRGKWLVHLFFSTEDVCMCNPGVDGGGGIELL